jgi:hypothetical protein
VKIYVDDILGHLISMRNRIYGNGIKYTPLQYERCCNWDATAMWDVQFKVWKVVLCFKAE